MRFGESKYFTHCKDCSKRHVGCHDSCDYYKTDKLFMMMDQVATSIDRKDHGCSIRPSSVARERTRRYVLKKRIRNSGYRNLGG